MPTIDGGVSVLVAVLLEAGVDPKRRVEKQGRLRKVGKPRLKLAKQVVMRSGKSVLILMVVVGGAFLVYYIVSRGSSLTQATSNHGGVVLEFALRIQNEKAKPTIRISILRVS